MHPLLQQSCSGDANATDCELSLSEHYRILDELTEAGCLWLLFTGGGDFFNAMINLRRDCSQTSLDVRLTPAEVVKLDLKYPERVYDWKCFAARLNHAAIDLDRAENLHACGAGHNSFAIDPYGRLGLCVLSTTDSYDLRQGCFKEGWGKHLAAVRREKASQITKCATCRLKSMCGICPANSVLECMDAEEPVDFLCQVAHLRAYALDLPIAPHGECEYCRDGSRYEDIMNTIEDLKGC